VLSVQLFVVSDHLILSLVMAPVQGDADMLDAIILKYLCFLASVNTCDDGVLSIVPMR
jgi:hypothetical protein